MTFASFWSDLIATIAGGIVLALLFFLAKEKWFPPPHLTGRWYLEQLTKNTAYAPYAGMILRYVVVLWREGNRVEGTAEKIYEISRNGERPFVGEKRTRAIISGYLEKRYFGRDKIYLHVVEDGHGRESTHYYDLVVTDIDTMCGTFVSMVADQNGLVKWQREPF